MRWRVRAGARRRRKVRGRGGPRSQAISAARIWMSAWVAAPRRPELAAEVDRRMLDGLDVLAEILRRGQEDGVFQVADPAASALRILVLVDGVLVQMSMRADAPYGDVHALVWDTVEREVGMPNGSLRSTSTEPGPADADFPAAHGA
ncbi:TetR family transcriptional regulator C-terminal domain-containing protein [Streptomyces sp. NPDC048496]|uniref:TetR family transcriptional regulator C-terminal domain-containing protein n=1 Tax=Streptomyces sp. NPDC048496 TaxID=3365558 RepID=UPI003713C41E